MKKICLLLLLAVASASYGADLEITSIVSSAALTPPAYSNPQPGIGGIRYQRVRSDSVQPIPRRDVTTDADTTPHLFYYRDTLYQKVSGVASPVGGGSGTTDSTVFATVYRLVTDSTVLRNLINGKLNLSDTAAAFSAYARLQRVQDSLTAIRGRINGAGVLSTSTQPNITSIGTLSSLTVSGTVISSKFSGSGISLTGVVRIIDTATMLTPYALLSEIPGRYFQPISSTTLTTAGTYQSISVTGNIVGESTVQGQTLIGNGGIILNTLQAGALRVQGAYAVDIFHAITQTGYQSLRLPDSSGTVALLSNITASPFTRAGATITPNVITDSIYTQGTVFVAQDITTSQNLNALNVISSSSLQGSNLQLKRSGFSNLSAANVSLGSIGANVINYWPSKSDTLAVKGDIPVLNVTLTTGSAVFTTTAGMMVDKIVITDPATISVGVGTSPSNYYYSPLASVNSGAYSTFIISQYFATATPIYFNGVTSNTVIKIYKQ